MPQPDDYSLFPDAKISEEVTAPEGGYVKAIIADRIGVASQHTGAGRAVKEDTIDLAAGIYLNAKTGDKVKKGDILATVYGNDKKKVQQAVREVLDAYTITDEKTEPEKLIKKIIQL